MIDTTVAGQVVILLHIANIMLNRNDFVLIKHNWDF